MHQYEQQFLAKHNVSAQVLRTFHAIKICRTKKLGGHKQKCGSCGKVEISYNSCRNRHCPK
ncbi:transposase zinc-binding domain-containing protein, partial [Klebsiella pneumoniae]